MPWPGVSFKQYLIGFRETSFNEGSLTERYRFEAVGTVGGKVTATSVDACEVWVRCDFFEASEDFPSSCKIPIRIPKDLSQIRRIAY